MRLHAFSPWLLDPVVLCSPLMLLPTAAWPTQLKFSFKPVSLVVLEVNLVEKHESEMAAVVVSLAKVIGAAVPALLGTRPFLSSRMTITAALAAAVIRRITLEDTPPPALEFARHLLARLVRTRWTKWTTYESTFKS